MFADDIYALDTAELGLMPIAAMSAVTKIPEATLEELSRKLPALEFGPEPFASLGGVKAVWSSQEDLAARLGEALKNVSTTDDRARLGKKRGGRTLAFDVQAQVLKEFK